MLILRSARMVTWQARRIVLRAGLLSLDIQTLTTQQQVPLRTRITGRLLEKQKPAALILYGHQKTQAREACLTHMF
jgi:hypothetical protein